MNSIKQIYQVSVDGSSRYYETKIVPYQKGLSGDFMFGNFVQDCQKAGLSPRAYLWKIIQEWDNPSDSSIQHWQGFLRYCVRPRNHKHCLLVYSPEHKEVAETLLRCLKWMENQDIYDIITTISAR